MAFAINFWYDPVNNKKDFTEGKLIKWKTFGANGIKHAVISEGDKLILNTHPGTKKETTVFTHPLRMDPDKKHMVALVSNDKTVTIYLDSVSIKQIDLPKITKLFKKKKPKKLKPEKAKAKKPKAKKPKKPKPKKLEPKKKPILKDGKRPERIIIKKPKPKK